MHTRFFKAMALARFNNPEPEASGDGLLAGGDGTAAPAEPQAEQGPQAADVQRPAQPQGLLASGDAEGKTAPEGQAKTDIPEQFINKETGEVNVDALAKSYNDLRAEFNRTKNGQLGNTPKDADGYLDALKDENGNFVQPEGTDRFRDIPSDDPAIAAAANAAKEAGLTDKQFQTLLSLTMAEWNGLLPEPLDLDAERDKLGKNAVAMVNANKGWIDGLFEQGLMTEDLHARALELGRDAVGVKLMQVLREQSGEMAIPTNGAQAFDQPMTQAEWYNMTLETHGKPGEDFQAFQERKVKLGEQIFGTEPSGTSPQGLGVPQTSSAHLRTKSRR